MKSMMKQNPLSPTEPVGQMAVREQVSLLADGELRGEEFAQALKLATTDPAAAAAWHEFHVVGDVLRSVELGGTLDGAMNGPGFLARFRERLQQDGPGLQASSGEPQNAINLVAEDALLTGTGNEPDAKYTAANDASFRRRLLAGVALLAVAGAVGWSALLGIGGNNGGQEAKLPAADAVAAVQAPTNSAPRASGATQEPMVMIRDPHLDALMAAHKQFGGTSALQMPAGFLRNATFEGDGR